MKDLKPFKVVEIDGEKFRVILKPFLIDPFTGSKIFPINSDLFQVLVKTA